MTVCCLCGEHIKAEHVHEQDARDLDHVPPKQFFPKAIRETLRGSLWKVPTHKKCNQKVKLDEEYFYHYFYPLVGFQNAEMGQVLLDDLKRRAAKPQSKALIRRMLKEMTHHSPGGIVLPPNLVRVNYDIMRVQNVIVKIAKGIFYKDQGRYLPREACVHMELCERITDLQPLFADLWQVKELQRDSAVPTVFRYWHFELDGQHYYSMLFWEAFMFCMIFREPSIGHGTIGNNLTA
jgi:hypothetical protein